MFQHGKCKWLQEPDQSYLRGIFNFVISDLRTVYSDIEGPQQKVNIQKWDHFPINPVLIWCSAPWKNQGRKISAVKDYNSQVKGLLNVRDLGVETQKNHRRLNAIQPRTIILVLLLPFVVILFTAILEIRIRIIYYIVILEKFHSLDGL